MSINYTELKEVIERDMIPKSVLEQIKAELYEDYESYSASEVNFDFACGIKRAIDTIDYHIRQKVR